MTKQEVEQILKDYHWMVREINRLLSLLGDAGERIVINYEGLDMPKPKGLRSDPVAFEAIRREKDHRKLKRYMEKVKFVQDRLDWIQDERERTILDCMLDGMTVSAIANHMGCTRKTVRTVRESIIRKFLAQEKAPA